MSVAIQCEYQGNLDVMSTHGPSGSKITTTAPVDNGGTGTLFSPTDLMAASLGSCILTVMGLMAKRHDWDIVGSYATVTKIMQSSPRRVGEIKVELHLPQRLGDKERKVLTAAAETCPVKQSLHPDIQIDLNFIYDL